MTLGTILLIVLIIALLGGFSGIGLLLVIVLVLVLMGRI